MAETSPSVIVLAGPNGAGKTTASRTLLADALHVLTFVNADVIAQGLAGFNPESAALEADADAGNAMTQHKRSVAEILADHDLITPAIRRAVQHAVLQHAREGHAIAASENGLVVWLPAAKILAQQMDERNGGSST